MTGSLVAVVAHPDDESLIAGGTLALAAAAGTTTGVVSLTRGEHGPIPAGAAYGPEQLGEIREAELRAAARELGAAWSVCLRHPDKLLPWVDHAAIAEELAGLLERCAPAALLTFGPDGLDWHPDHIAVMEIVSLAARQLGASLQIYEAAWPQDLMVRLVEAAAARGLPVGLWGADPRGFGSERAPTVEIDVRPVLDRKLAALRAHRTQIDAEHLFAALPEDLAERFLGVEPWTGPDGVLQGLTRGA